MIVTSHSTSDEASFFVTDGIYSPPSVTEIWIDSGNSNVQKIWSAEQAIKK